MRRCAKEANDRFFLSVYRYSNRGIFQWWWNSSDTFIHFSYLFIYFSFHPIFLLSFELNKKEFDKHARARFCTNGNSHLNGILLTFIDNTRSGIFAWNQWKHRACLIYLNIWRVSFYWLWHFNFIYYVVSFVFFSLFFFFISKEISLPVSNRIRLLGVKYCFCFIGF